MIIGLESSGGGEKGIKCSFMQGDKKQGGSWNTMFSEVKGAKFSNIEQ